MAYRLNKSGKRLFAAGLLILILGVSGLGYQIYTGVVASYRYERDIYSFWELADKSSTIDAKYNYIDNMVDILEGLPYAGQHNAVWLKTMDNSWDYNLKALTTLRDRLGNIISMDPKSFEYNTAIQQITAQEQGEAKPMLNTIDGIWTKNNYWNIWGWWLAVIVGVLFAVAFLGVILMVIACDDEGDYTEYYRD